MAIVGIRMRADHNARRPFPGGTAAMQERWEDESFADEDDSAAPKGRRIGSIRT